MLRSKKKMRFLSESILLEESGLPKMNFIIVITVTAIILLFLLWSNQLVMEDSISIKGQVVSVESNGDVEFLGLVRTGDLVSIMTNAETKIDIPGITNRQSLNGKVTRINTQAKYDSNDTAYYEVYVVLINSENNMDELNGDLLPGMDSELEIVTDSRTMLQFLLGTLYDTGKDAFDIK